MTRPYTQREAELDPVNTWASHDGGYGWTCLACRTDVGGFASFAAAEEASEAHGCSARARALAAAQEPATAPARPDGPPAPARPVTPALTARPCPTCGAVEAPALTPVGLAALADAVRAAGSVQ